MALGGLFSMANEKLGLRSHARRIDNATPFAAGGSTLQSGGLNFDPLIAELRGESLEGIRGLRDEASGNQNAFIQARVNPLQARVDANRGALQRSLGRRGVFGSFANQDKTNFDLDSQRALGDARSLATNESLQFRTALNDRIASIAQQIQSGDLAGLGLSVNSVLGLHQGNLGTAALQDAAGARAGKLLEKIIGGAMSSSRSLKENNQEIDVNDILEKFTGLDVEKWTYKGEAKTHYGTYAEDFNEAFDLEDNPYIEHVDMFGVMMASIKALTHKVKELEAKS